MIDAVIATTTPPLVSAFIGAGTVLLVAVTGFVVKLATTSAGMAEHLKAIDRALDRIERRLGIGSDRNRSDDP